MAHRSNDFLVVDGKAAVYGKTSGALDLPADLLAGPEAVLELIQGRDPMEQPYSEDRAEGGSFVDADRRILRFYTRRGPISESVGLRRAFMPLLAERWPGWQVSYAKRGLRDLLEPAGWPPGGLLTERPAAAVTPRELRAAIETVTTMWHVSLSHDEYIGLIEASSTWSSPPYPYEEMVVTVRSEHAGRGERDDNNVRDYPIGAELELAEVLALGPQLLGVLADLPGALLPKEQCVHSGVFIDIPAKTVHMWAGADSPELPAVARQWPGWRFTEHDGGLPAQAALSGRDGRAVTLPHDVLVAEAYATFYAGPEERDYRRLLQQGVSWSPDRYRGLGKEVTALLRQLAAGRR